MTAKRIPKNRFSNALKQARGALGVPQERFSLASSRTYVSTLERGIKSPTLNKVDALAEVLELHPLTLLTLSYLTDANAPSIQELITRVTEELALVQSK